MSTAWKRRGNPPSARHPLWSEGGLAGEQLSVWGSGICSRTAGLRAANCGDLLLSFFLTNTAAAGWSQGVEQQPPPPTPPQRRCSKEAEEKVGGVNGRDLCMTRRHGAVVYPREAANEQPTSERLYIKTGGGGRGRTGESCAIGR